MGRPHFEDADFIEAARAIADARGPAGVTVDSVTERLSAPKGSFYYRFASRDILLGRLWLSTVLDFQVGFHSALEAGDGLSAALHTSVWSRERLADARLLLLYGRHDFVQGEWPEDIKRGAREQAQRLEASIVKFARARFDQADADQLQRVWFALVQVPIAAVKPYLERREAPPPLVDELITKAHDAVLGGSAHAHRLKESAGPRPTPR